MQRQGFDIPLLIGGATTSRAHTAVKIDPQYDGPVVWIKDASRSVPAVSQLLSEGARQAYLAGITADYDALRARHAARSTERPLATLREARENATPWTGATYRPPRPRMLERQGPTAMDVLEHGHRAHQFTKVCHEYSVAELRPYIDWQPFFNAWEIRGSYPDLLDSPEVGEAARRLLDDAEAMLDRIEREGWLNPQGAIGFFPAAARGDDIVVYTDEGRTEERLVLHHLRQQGQHREGVANKCLSDFVAPEGAASPTTSAPSWSPPGPRWWTGSRSSSRISTTTTRSCWRRWPTGSPRRSPSGCTSGCGASSGATHPTSTSRTGSSIKEQYVGIRPAPGYPACPEHTEKAALWDLLDVDKQVGVTLTESMAMWPGASVSGWYFSHPQSQYFVVGRLGRDQVADYAQRKGWTLQEAERWLAPNLGYEPED